jgi:hypothetical protein
MSNPKLVSSYNFCVNEILRLTQKLSLNYLFYITSTWMNLSVILLNIYLDEFECDVDQDQVPDETDLLAVCSRKSVD